jgi:hypothetical protein
MKRLFAASFVVLFAGLCLYLLCKPAPLPTSDLASPSQDVRDAAAKVLRANAKPPRKIKWIFFTYHIKAGETETNILELLRSYKLSTQREAGMGGLSDYWEYRLDDYWLLGCEFNNNDYTRKILERWKLIPRWRDYYILPPTNFNGIWVTYYANGQKSSEANYINGYRSGEFMNFSPSGSTNSVWHYDHGKANGLWTQYFPSGRIEIQCLYSNQLRVGDMVWYYEDGAKRSILHYDNGRKNGLWTVYFPSGKIESQGCYSNDKKIGIEVHYNEDGSTNRVIDNSKP